MSVTDINAEVAGNVFSLLAAPGDRVSANDTVLVLESMKMELPVIAPVSGLIQEILVEEGSFVAEGQLLVRFVPDE